MIISFVYWKWYLSILQHTSTFPHYMISYLGTYCPSGTPYPLQCSYGKYCDQYGLPLPSADCNAGYYCDGGASQPDPYAGRCPPGHYCEQGVGTPAPCPTGVFCCANKHLHVFVCIESYMLRLLWFKTSIYFITTFSELFTLLYNFLHNLSQIDDHLLLRSLIAEPQVVLQHK